MAVCTYIDGIASSQAIDTAGEIVDIRGLDCSSLMGAAFNYEHKSDVPAQIVGKVLEFKKIFSEQDCETDRQKMYWQKITMPFLYVLGRLFDDKKESSKEIAALFRDDSENPNEPKMVGFSIEGAKVNKDGMTITRSIARKVTITNLPANKTCEANMVPAQRASRNDPDSLFKGEIEFFNPNSNYLEMLQKREEDMEKSLTGKERGVHVPTVANPGQSVMGSHVRNPSTAGHGSKEMARRHAQSNLKEMKGMPKPNLPKSENMNKDVGSGGGAMIGDSLAMGELEKSIGPSWKHTGGGNFSHPEHGIVSVSKQPTGEFHVRHNGAMAGLGGQKASFGTAAAAGAHAGNYMRAVGQKKVLAPGAQNRPSPQMNKALEAGSGMGAPSSLTGGAALGKEDLGGKMKKAGFSVGIMSGKNNSGQPKEETAGIGTAMNTTVGKSDTGGMGTMGLSASEKKSKWLLRAEQAYKTWEKREQFETFMKSKMPHLTKGEIQAIGQTIALKKSIEAEKGKVSTFFRKGTDIMMAKEKT
jgi:hypothetical protein